MLQSMRGAAKYVWWILIVAFVGSFLFYETSGLAGRAPVSLTSPVATVNGEDILLTDWQNAVSNLEQTESQRLGRAITLDERRVLEDQAFDQMVTEILLRQEYKRRGISVSDDEVRQAAQMAPPPQAIESPDLQTDGQFDITKYRRLLASPMARQSGILANLEAYYRSEIPRQKLMEQVVSDVFVSDQRAWQIYRDRHDSAQVSYVVMSTNSLTDTAVSVTDSEIRQYYERNRKRFELPGRAVVSLITIPRTITAADTAAARARIERLRGEITGGASFEEVARRESADSISARDGGSLGPGVRNRFVPAFEEAAYALRPGEMSQPVQTQFGFHLIRVDSRRGDTLNVRHILVPIEQSDSSATVTDRRADSVSAIAASTDDPRKFDEAVQKFGLSAASLVAFEREPLIFAGRVVPSVSAWAFSGPRVGETSDLFDSEDAYYVARIDSLRTGGPQPLDAVRDDIRRRLQREKLVEKLIPLAQQVVTAAQGSSLETVASQRALTVERTGGFARPDLVPGLGQFTEAIGAAFTAPVGRVSGPYRTADGVAIMRVDSRTEAQRAAFEAQKDEQRTTLTQQLRQQRVREYFTALREGAKIEDNRAKVMAQLRRQSDV